MGRLVLVLGGARSGKSAFAQELARARGGDGVLYVATAAAGDEEMQERIARHRQARPANWRTLELQQDVAAGLREPAQAARVVLVDCLTLLVSNLVVAVPDPFAAGVEEQVLAEVAGLIDCARAMPGDMVIVSNEVGMGLVPPYPLGRAFRDIVGRANQELARAADEVYLLVAGLPMTLKGKTP